MVDDLLYGRVTSFRREQGFGVITLDDGRDVKFDASICTMVPEEGGRVLLRIGPAKWGGGFKALHVEPGTSAMFPVAAAPPTLDQQIAALQREHLASTLSELVMTQLTARAFGGRVGDATLVDVLDAFYAADPACARGDGYLRLAPHATAADAAAAIAAALPGFTLPATTGAAAASDVVALANKALVAAGDPRRLYPLRTTGRFAYFVLPADRAQRLAATLPFAT